jgi:hypothetical protein
MFVIMVPVCIAPALVVLFWADRKARRTGALSLASSSYARKQILKKEGALQMTTAQQLVYYFHRVDVIGLILLAFSFGLILVPVTLSASMEGGYSNSTSGHSALGSSREMTDRQSPSLPCLLLAPRCGSSLSAGNGSWRNIPSCPSAC